MPISDYRVKSIIEDIINNQISDLEIYNKLKKIIYSNEKELENKSEQEIQDYIYDFVTEKIYYNIKHAQITIGGYADFTQEDYRLNKKFNKNLTECLLKIDSEGEYEFYIGDAGILSVCISESDMKNCNFENAVLDWDCL